MRGPIYKVILLIFGFNLIILNSFSQDSVKIDSLLTGLSEALEDTTRIDILLQLFWEYRRSDPNVALEYANLAMELSQRTGNLKDLAQSLQNIGIIRKVQGEYEIATTLIQEAKDNFEKIKDTLGIVSCLIDLSDIFNQQNNHDLALKYLDEARLMIARTGDKERLSRIYNKLGGIYYVQKQYEKALEYHKKSLEINMDQDFKLGMSVNYNNMGNVYLDLKQYDAATENYLKSLEIKKEIKDDTGIAAILNNLGLIYSDQGNFDKALDYHSQALDIAIKLGDRPRIAMFLANIANDHLEAGDFPKAIEYAKTSLDLAEETRQMRIQTEVYRILSEAYAALEQYQKAFQYQKLYKTYHDSTVNAEIVRQITEMESRFEVEKKEKEIALLNADKERNELKMKQQRSQRNLMIGLTILVLVILLFLFWGYRNKQKLNKKLKELNLTKSRFFANISHEFRTPLTLLLGPLEKLLEKAKPEDKEMIRMMHRNASRLLLLDNQLLDLSKLEAGKLNLKVSLAEITQILKGMVMSFQSLAEKKHIDFKSAFPDEGIYAYFDQDKLEKIVYNVLSNALKFTPDNGKVIFDFEILSGKDKKELSFKLGRIAGRIACISIGDTGPGIAKEYLPLIFDRFYQVDSRLNKSFEGTGLGLSLSKELVELHHGKISVQSEEGKGSTFCIYLPIDKKAYKENEIFDEKDETIVISPVSGYAESKGEDEILDKKANHGAGQTDEVAIKILIVEDNKDMRAYIRDCFDQDYSILEAADGKIGFEMATAEIPDIIISDLMMPELDGIELCKKIKTDDSTCHIPVVLLTALSSIEDRVKGLETGADDYIAKPFNRQELVTRVRNLTDQRKLLRERFGRDIKIQPKDVTVTSSDEKFLIKLITFVERNLSDPDLIIDDLIEEINLSRSQLHRKLKALTGMSATEFIRTIRLKRAAQLLEQHYGTVAETVYAVGFNNLSYFSKCFQKQFGLTPKAYIESRGITGL